MSEGKNVRKCWHIFPLCFTAHPVGNVVKDSLHHGQMLAVVVRLEECLARVQLEHDAANGPHIARLGPSQFLKISFKFHLFATIRTKNDFGCAIVASGNNG